MRNYRILIHPDTYQRTSSYLKAIQTGLSSPGSYLQSRLDNVMLSQLTTHGFIELLINTKLPQIFAESDILGNGSDWTQLELSILGDIAIAVPVTVFDNGLHRSPKIHPAPFSATLLFVPGALLQNGRGFQPVDWSDVTADGSLSFDAYYSLYERRLLPSFIYANEMAGSLAKQALMTIPGLGCGLFAGKFRGQLGIQLSKVLYQFLSAYAGLFPNIKVVYYDPYREGNNERFEINHISYLIRPLTRGNENKPQLCSPQTYEDPGDDFSQCVLFSFVAWDHVSWPGNDFYVGSRATDDGVKAAATNSMTAMTGIEGSYDVYSNTYNPPEAYQNWGEVIRKEQISLQVQDNLMVLPKS